MYIKKALILAFITLLIGISILSTNAKEEGEKLNPIVIVTFGNSITAPRKTVDKVFTQRIDEFFSENRIDVKVINSGIPGSHTGHQTDHDLFKIPHALDRFESDVLNYNPDIVIIGFGTNDAHIDNNISIGPSRIPLHKFKANLEYMIRMLEKEDIKIILIAPNILGSNYGDVQNERLKKYVDVVRDLADKYKTALVDNYQLFTEYQKKTSLSYESLMLDGVHPNDKGHELIAKELIREIMNILDKENEKNNGGKMSCFNNYKSDNKFEITHNWTVSKGIPLPDEWKRSGHSGGIVAGHVCIAGGNKWSEDKSFKIWFDNTLIFKNDNWIEGPPLPIPLSYSVFANDSSGFYIAGGTCDGITMSRAVFVLKSIKNDAKWEKLPDLPEAFAFGSGAILNGKFYVSGGMLTGGQKTNRMWVLDTKDLEFGWTNCDTIPGITRMLHTLVACGEDLFLLGGLADFTPLTPLDDLFKYDPRKDEWEKLQNLPIKGYAWDSIPIDEKNLLITGRADGMVHRDILAYNLETMEIKKIGDLIIPSTTAPLIKVSNNQWWFVGGEPDPNKNRTEKVSVIKLN